MAQIQTITDVYPMQSSKVRSRLKAQLTKFSSELAEGLSKSQREFVGEMFLGIQASQDVKLSNIARSLDEEIPLIKTEDRLARNLKAEELEDHGSERLQAMGSRRVEANTVLCLVLSVVRKGYAKKMEYLDEVWHGSEGEVHQVRKPVRLRNAINTLSPPKGLTTRGVCRKRLSFRSKVKQFSVALFRSSADLSNQLQSNGLERNSPLESANSD